MPSKIFLMPPILIRVVRDEKRVAIRIRPNLAWERYLLLPPP